MMKTMHIAAIPGDRIGKEVLPEGIHVLQAATEHWGFALSFEQMEWASCKYYSHHSKMMPDNWHEQLSHFNTIYFGAISWPDTIPDHISLWGSLLKFHHEFNQYINLRPVHLFPGVPCPLAGKQPGNINFYMVRENTKGKYSSLSSRVNEGTEHEVIIQESVFTRHGVNHILHYAFKLAQSHPHKTLTSATKSNSLAISMPYWDEQVEAMAKNYPEIHWDKQHIDILCTRFVMQPEQFNVVVASNLFGNILSNLGPACISTIGIAPSTNLNPEHTFPSLFKPVHSSTPDIYRKNIANPITTIWARAMMLNFLSNGNEHFQQAHNSILAAIEEVIAHRPKTPDMKGNATTPQVANTICKIILR